MSIFSNPSSPPAQAASTGHAPNNMGVENDATGMAGLFARVASEIESAQPKLTEQAEENTVFPETAMDSGTELATSTVTNPLAELATIETLNMSLVAPPPDSVSELPGTADLPKIDADIEPQVSTAHNMMHAISILEDLQTDKFMPAPIKPEQSQARAPLNRLATALQALNNAANPGNTEIGTARQQMPALPETVSARALEQVQKLLTEIPVLPTVGMDVAGKTTTPLPEVLLKGMAAVSGKSELLSLEATVSEAKPPAVAQLAAGNHVMSRSDGTPTIVKMDIPGSIQQPAWRQALAERIVMATSVNIRQAELHLHPADLGPVNVRIETHQERAAIQFTAVHADTREALDAALPRLREMFNQQGIDLVRADIQQHMSGQQDAHANHSDASDSQTSSSLMPEPEETLVDLVREPRRSDRLLDLYA